MADNTKHIITAKDKETGKTRQFIFEGNLVSESLIVEEVNLLNNENKTISQGGAIEA